LKNKIAIIGSGFSGLSAACFLAKAGHEVSVFEKNSQLGGRARVFESNGYVFDMGPSWYWMPDVFERFFAEFGKKPSDFYELVKLDPGFSMFFGKDDVLDIPASMDEVYRLFDQEEENGAEKLRKFLREAELKYDISFKNFIYKPSESIFEFVNFTTLKNLPRLDLFNSFRSHIRKYFTSERLLKLMEFPILFLGGSPENIPALYSLMNYSALVQGTWYPQGGFYKIIEGMVSVARELGVHLHIDSPVSKINVEDKSVHSVTLPSGKIFFDAVIGSSDYAHTESLLDENFRNYSSTYWDKRVFSPSCLIFYVGLKKKLPKLRHHNLFFDRDLQHHSDQIYKKPSWPSDPLFYVCCPSKTDQSVAPAGHENLFFLMPLAAGLEDSENNREKYFAIMLNRLEQILGEEISSSIDYRRSYCLNNFINDYNSCKGNAYGLANTLRQTAVLKPALRNKKVKNLYYCGQLTVPGPGVPPALISGQIAAQQLFS
jgi:phytoene desaturase